MRITLLPACFLLIIGPAQAQDRPLPDQASFMEEFRKTLSMPQKLLSQYTYIYKETEITLDSKGNPKKTETNVYEVIHGAEEWQTYERHVSKNGGILGFQNDMIASRADKPVIRKQLWRWMSRLENPP